MTVPTLCDALRPYGWPPTVAHTARDGPALRADAPRPREGEAEKERMEALGRLAVDVAHDVNNILAVIKSYGQLLIEALERGDDRRGDALEIVRASDRAAVLTRQLLTLGGRQTVRPAGIDVSHVVGETEKMLRRLLGAHVDLELRLATGLPQVRIDPVRVEQLLMNLVVNARDAIAGDGRIVIETAAVLLEDAEAARVPGGSAAGAYVRLAVSDTGAGMDAATQVRIFEPFFTTKRQGEGTGLGLSIVRGIVEQSRGFVRAESTPGEGTTFEVYLPCDTTHAASSTATERGERP